MTTASVPGIGSAWAALGGDPDLLARVSNVVREGALPARLPVLDLARSCVGACSLAAAELAARRTGSAVPAVRVDDGAVATAFVSERHLLTGDTDAGGGADAGGNGGSGGSGGPGGRAPGSFAPLSRFWRTSDGWVRTHANYPHHRTRLLAALGLSGQASAPADVEAVLAGCRAVEVEEAVYAAGGLAVALRTPGEWAAHEQGRASAAGPLLSGRALGAHGTRARWPGRAAPHALSDGGAVLPAAGVRVLDLTRVLAGPVATRTLALLGADVLRVDPPHLPELADQHTDTGFGKRSTTLDLTGAADRRTFDALLAGADVVVTGYRPGALDRLGLGARALAERRPGLVVAQLSAWGADGPWQGRRGFDSLVQVASGIAVAEGSPEQPGALPAQALDHGTGYLLAAAVLRSLTDQLDDGGGRHVRLALARTAAWLTGRDEGTAPGGTTGAGTAGNRVAVRPGAPYDPADPAPWLATMDSPMGRLRHALPPVGFVGGPVNWASPPSRWGTDSPEWR